MLKQTYLINIMKVLKSPKPTYTYLRKAFYENIEIINNLYLKEVPDIEKIGLSYVGTNVYILKL